MNDFYDWVSPNNLVIASSLKGTIEISSAIKIGVVGYSIIIALHDVEYFSIA